LPQVELTDKSLLAILAHPDDESFMMGGTLARYSALGVDVHVAIATDGAAGSIDERWTGDRDKLAEARSAELAEASEILGVTIHTLGYRDSGYRDVEANGRQDAFINADHSEVVSRLVDLIRELKPAVVLTHNADGEYGHQDHVKCHQVTTDAFYLASDPDYQPNPLRPPFAPQRLFYGVIPRSRVRLYGFLMRLQGSDPKRAGRNKDIDFTRLGTPRSEVHVAIDYSPYWDIKVKAGASHASQGGGTGSSRLFPTWLQKRLFSREMFTRAFPKPTSGKRADDLFSGLSEAG